MIASLAAVSLAAAVGSPAASVPDPEPASSRTAAVASWERLRFGMFIHWGMATFTGDELGRGANPIGAYQPTSLDVDQWVRVARSAGMRYAVLTTKHCTGHCLWPSAHSDYTVAQSAVTTDVVGAFVTACRRHNVAPGFYYLLGWDAHHQPKMDPATYERFCTAQIEELLTRHGPIAELWLDIPFDMGPDTAGALQRLYVHAKRLQPRCMVMLNQGFTDGTAISRIAPSYYWQPAGGDPVPMWPRDLIGGERTLPPPGGHNPWMDHNGKRYYIPMEVCDTLGRSWFWMPEDALRSPEALYRLYRNTIDRGASLLLDVAPDRTGRLPVGTVQRLQELGRLIRSGKPPAASLAAGRPARASNVYRNDERWGAASALDEDAGTRWATDETVSEAWIEVDLGGPTTFRRAFVSEGWDRVRGFAIEVPDGNGGWRAVFTGGRIPREGAICRFGSVTASTVRLHILEAPGGPTIWDFEVYP